MYRCDLCGSVTPPGTPANRVAIETRVVEYPRREDAHWHPPKNGGKGKWVDDLGGRGVEIVRELVACPACMARNREPKERPPPALSAA